MTDDVPYVKAADILSGELEGRTVGFRGWIHRQRGSGKLAFWVLRDVTGLVQATIFRPTVGDDAFKDAKKALVESSVELTGKVAKDERAPGGFEVQVETVTVVGFADNFPITKDQSEEFLNDQRHLWVRSRRLTNSFKVRSTVFGAVHSYFRGEGFFEVQAPILTSAQCEGGSTLFEVSYYDRKTYLAQSWQLYAEAMVFALEKIYDMAPSFRAEKSKTSRHLTEYWHAEMEIAWGGLDDVLVHAERLISHICREVAQKNVPELEFFGRDPQELLAITPPFPRVKYAEALEMLEEKAGLKVPYGKDLRTVEEESISKLFDKPVIVTHYPEEIMAFYKPEDPEDPGKCLCFDMLATEGFGEIIGGSQRDTDIDRLVEKLKLEGEDVSKYEWYLDLRRYGSVPHAGFGMGVERVVRWLLRLDHIRDAIPFPRTMTRINP